MLTHHPHPRIYHASVIPSFIIALVLGCSGLFDIGRRYTPAILMFDPSPSIRTSDLCTSLRALAAQHGGSLSLSDVRTCASEAKAALGLFWAACNTSLDADEKDKPVEADGVLRQQQAIITAAQDMDMPDALSTMWQLLAKLCRRLQSLHTGMGKGRKGCSPPPGSQDAALAANDVRNFLETSISILGMIHRSTQAQVRSLNGALEQQEAARAADAPNMSSSGATGGGGGGGGSGSSAKAAARAKPAADSAEIVESRRLMRTMSLLLGQMERSKAVLSLLEAVSTWTELVCSVAVAVPDDDDPQGTNREAAAAATADPRSARHLVEQAFKSMSWGLEFALMASLGERGCGNLVHIVVQMVEADEGAAVGGGRPSASTAAGRRARPTPVTLLACLSDLPRAFCQQLRVMAVSAASRTIQLWTTSASRKALQVCGRVLHDPVISRNILFLMLSDAYQVPGALCSSFHGCPACACT